jgi:hypothetical protein
MRPDFLANTVTRRALLRNTLKISAGIALAPKARGFGSEDVSLTLKLRKGVPVSIPANFTGLGYEMSSVAAPGLLSATNHRYVELIKGLGPEGVLRAGGIVANYTRYEPNGAIMAERQNTLITRASLEQFAAFLKRIGWTAIWSVNFAQGSIDSAVEEARAVADVLGSRLLALEIGNEVDSYGKGQPFRSSSYDYESYRKEYNEWHAAILKAVPHIRFAAPDTASSVEWVERMAQDEKGDVQLLTTHYYRNGQKHGSAEQLLVPDPRLEDILRRLRTVSEQSGIPWRMCETNSFSGGGRPGVSDTLVGALWTLDTMLLLASYGCSGVNMETGVNQLGFISSYSPIQDDGKGLNTAGVPYYGMLAFATAVAGGRQILPINLDNRGVNLTVYVLGAGGTPRCTVLVNKDSSHDAQVSIAELGMGDVSALRLLSPAPYSTTGVSFGGSSVDPEGRWSAKSQDRIRDGNVVVPRMSAVVVRSSGSISQSQM